MMAHPAIISVSIFKADGHSTASAETCSPPVGMLLMSAAVNVQLLHVKDGNNRDNRYVDNVAYMYLVTSPRNRIHSRMIFYADLQNSVPNYLSK
jgi:hypothetical protein